VVDSCGRHESAVDGQFDKSAQQAERMSNGSPICEASDLVENVLSLVSGARTQQLHHRLLRLSVEDVREPNSFVDYYTERPRPACAGSSRFSDGSWWLGCKSFAPFSAAGCTLFGVRLHRFEGSEKGCKSCGVVDPRWIDAVLGGSPTAATCVSHRQQPGRSPHRRNMHLDRSLALARLRGHVLDAGSDAVSVVVRVVSVSKSGEQLATACRVVFPNEAHDLYAHRPRRPL
jgi:hypothetical protein